MGATFARRASRRAALAYSTTSAHTSRRRRPADQSGEPPSSGGHSPHEIRMVPPPRIERGTSRSTICFPHRTRPDISGHSVRRLSQENVDRAQIVRYCPRHGVTGQGTHFALPLERPGNILTENRTVGEGPERRG